MSWRKSTSITSATTRRCGLRVRRSSPGREGDHRDIPRAVRYGTPDRTDAAVRGFPRRCVCGQQRYCQVLLRSGAGRPRYVKLARVRAGGRRRSATIPTAVPKKDSGTPDRRQTPSAMAWRPDCSRQGLMPSGFLWTMAGPGRHLPGRFGLHAFRQRLRWEAGAIPWNGLSGPSACGLHRVRAIRCLRQTAVALWVRIRYRNLARDHYGNSQFRRSDAAGSQHVAQRPWKFAELSGAMADQFWLTAPERNTLLGVVASR